MLKLNNSNSKINSDIEIDFSEVQDIDTYRSIKVDVCSNIKPGEVEKVIDEFYERRIKRIIELEYVVETDFANNDY